VSHAEEDLLKPDTEVATRYIRAMERQGLKPGTIYEGYRARITPALRGGDLPPRTPVT